MATCCIPDYADAVRAEQDARNVIYLGQPEIVCGVKLNNITPYLLAVLSAIKTPFIVGGEVTFAHVAQFLWALHVEYNEQDATGPRRMLEVAARYGLVESERDIDEFLKVTFMDAPSGGAKSTPIASSVAWMVYRFRCEPFRQAEEITLHTPLRKLYQEIRCWTRDNGTPVTNQSDKIAGDWLEWLNGEIAAGRVTAEDITHINGAN